MNPQNNLDLASFFISTQLGGGGEQLTVILFTEIIWNFDCYTKLYIEWLGALRANVDYFPG